MFDSIERLCIYFVEILAKLTSFNLILLCNKKFRYTVFRPSDTNEQYYIRARSRKMSHFIERYTHLFYNYNNVLEFSYKLQLNTAAVRNSNKFAVSFNSQRYFVSRQRVTSCEQAILYPDIVCLSSAILIFFEILELLLFYEIL